jgi:methyl-accepting chemotaxis protein
MRWFHHLKIANKLLLAFAIVIALTCVMGVFSIVQLVKVSNASSDIARNWMPGTRHLGEVQTSLARYRISEATHILQDEEADMKAADKALATRRDTMKTQQDALAALMTDAEEQRLYGEFQKDIAAYMAESGKLTALSHAGNKNEARAVFKGTSNKIYRKLNEEFEVLAKYNDSGSSAAEQSAEQIFRWSRQLIIGAMLLLVAVGIALAVWVARMVARPLQDAVGVAQSVAGGDLTAAIDVDSRDETGMVMRALRDMNDSLARVVGQVRGSTDAIATASAQIASGNLDLSARTEDQASSLEETAAAMEELTATVRQNANNAKLADQLAQSASTGAADGGKVVDEVITTMAAISAASNQIVNIIAVIDGIAFQTNILALNAAVEAARAGEQGRGFAVVASEVRNLAQRSATAAKEIKQLIEASVQQMNSGTVLVQRAGHTMEQVVASVRHVSEVVADISASSVEQRAGIEEINKAIGQIDATTQHNAALVEEAAAATAAMQEEAAQLAAVMARFRLAGAPAAAGMHRAAKFALGALPS